MESPSLTSWVSLLMGTRSTPEFSRGSTLPLIQRPWAMTAWAPVTGDDPWFFHPDLPKLRGLKATRQASLGETVAGGVVFCPQTGPLITDPAGRASPYRLDRSLLTPYLLKTEFLRYRVTAELAPTARCALLRLTFAEGGASRLLIEIPGGTASLDPAAGEVSGRGPVETSGVLAGRSAVTLVGFDRPIARWGGEGCLVWVEFDLTRGASVEVRVSTSWNDEAQARVNYQTEVGSRSLERVAQDGEQEWNRLLGRIAVEGGNDDQRRTFYSCLYRILCVPRKVDHPGTPASGEMCWSPEPPGRNPLAYALYALAYRDELPALLQGCLQSAAAAPEGPDGFTEVVLAEALSKGLNKGLIPAAEPFCSQLQSGKPFGSEGEQYNRLGYLPHQPGLPSVSLTLDRAYRDWCLARLTSHYGGLSEVYRFEDRSASWQNLFDESMGFFRPKNSDGTWTDGFNPLAWGEGFAQGSAWQGGWAVPHDPEGLIAALGGAEVTLARLDTLLALQPWFHLHPGATDPPGVTEMAVADFGQYAHHLTAAQGILWFYAWAGRPDKTEILTRRVLQELYRPGVDGYCGGGGAGALSAWYVWTALGLFPFCPGSPDYLLGSPLFPRADIDSGDGRRLTIEAPETGPDRALVGRRTLGNVVLVEPRVSQADLFDLGRLVCTMRDGGD